jgi:hypothetical protein
MGSAFTYWDQADVSPLADVVGHWTERVGGLDIVQDDEVEAILARIAPAFVETYRLITIPAARSDLARLVLLHERGGLYVDSRCGVVDAERTRAILREARSEAIIAVDQSREERPRPKDQMALTNAMMAGGRGSAHILAIAGRVIGNLEAHRAQERAVGFRHYDLLALTGPESINALTFERQGGATRPRAHLEGRLTIWPEETFPVQRHRYQLESDRSRHWSERQRTERLFSEP